MEFDVTDPKLTPTFNDTKGNGLYVVQQHGPLASAPLPPIPMIMQPFPAPSAPEAPPPAAIPIIPMPLAINPDMPVAPDVKKPLKIALIGTAPTSRGLAPYNDPSWTIWSCSPGNMGVVPRADAWFEVHGNLLWPENKSYGEPYLEWLKRLPIPVYMQSQEWVPNARIFPMQEMVTKFGPRFFTSSFAWMMAFAIDQAADEIALYGIDMASRNEYILQRPGFYYFQTVAEQRGIKVSAPHESDIMQPPGLYGYSDVTPMGRKILARKAEISQRLTGMRQQRDQLSQQIIYLEGAAEDLDYFESIWMGQG
jgi:hypothetical protein